MANGRGYFITGTDTGVGKTAVALALMARLQAQGRRVAAMKPVATGCREGPAGLVNADALELQRQCSMVLPYARVNPCAFEPAIAPHIAAAQAGVRIALAPICRAFDVIAGQADCVVVEGVGGWLVPLNESETLADLARALALEVILVVGIRLGCLNHALLSAAAIESAGCTLAGWVANRLPPPAGSAQASIKALETRVSAPLLGEIPTLAHVAADRMAGYLSLPD